MNKNCLHLAKSYVLFLKVRRNIKVTVGRLGKIKFSKGYYLYVGSAKRGIESRLNRHILKDKNLFWHVDYLLKSPYTVIDEVWVAQGKKECSVASLLKEHFDFVERFGSSDCRCKSHLFFAATAVNRVRWLLHKGGFCNAGKGPF